MKSPLISKIPPLGKGVRLSFAYGLMASSSVVATAAVVVNFSEGTSIRGIRS